PEPPRRGHWPKLDSASPVRSMCPSSSGDTVLWPRATRARLRPPWRGVMQTDYHAFALVPRRTLGRCMRLKLALLTACIPAMRAAWPFAEEARKEPIALTGRIVAVGIPGAGAVAPVGFFHPGGPFHDNAAFAAFTQPGRILDRRRVLVAGSSNFGAPRARTDEAEGSVLSLDPDGPTIVVPP